MSKKIMKRSLALGALMAFVITGSAMAANYEDKTFTKVENIAPDNANGVAYHGGLFSLNSDDSFTNCHFDNNLLKGAKGESMGAAIYCTNDLTVTKSYFNGNTIDGGKARGAAIAHSNGTLVVSYSEFKENKILNGSVNYGTAIYSSGATLVNISNSKFLNNEGGRAVYFTGNTNAIISNNEFVGNTNGAVQAESTTTVINFEGLNTFEENGLETLMNKGTTNFLQGSTSIFTNNDLDICNKGGTINIEKDSTVTIGSGMEGTGTTNINEGTLEIGADSTIAKLGGENGIIRFIADADLTVTTNESKGLGFEATGDVNDAVGGDASTLLKQVDLNGETTVTMEEGKLQGEKVVTFNGDKEVVSETQKVNTKSDAVSDAGMTLKGHWRAHMNDMNKRMGELRNANGEHGVWTRMVRGESEYQGAKMQYNQYQMGYDEKLSVDKRWTVGAAVTFSEGDASYGSGSTDDKSTAFAIYGSKLNNDGTFVDLIARYARLESDLDDGNYGTGNYDANGYSVSAEFGKRIQQGKGLWIEPQVELTYGSVDGAQVNFSEDFTANYGSMDSFIARVGFAMGKDIKQGNVYARASYLYDFDGETETQFVGGDPISEDFGGGWWEVGVGANINLSKATYIYADVEKTFGGEVDTNWQWNLGVRYSF